MSLTFENGKKTRSVHVTFFRDKFARTLQTESMTIWDLGNLILHASAEKKADLHLLKLAKFGTVPSRQNCLRYNDNMISIDGIEIDYDGEKMSVNEATKLLKTTKLIALIYTSPSHTAKKPRWRLVLPTSRSLPPVEREKLVARVNGAFGGIIAPESFVQSQPMYFGRVGNNAEHSVAYSNGDYIDLRPDLDATARYKGKQPLVIDDNPWLAAGNHYKPPIDVEHRLETMRHKGQDETGIHATQLAVSASMLNAGADVEEVVEKLMEATRRAGEDHWNWAEEERNIRKMCASWLAKHPEIDRGREKTGIHATPFVWTDPSKIPLREWLYRPHYIRLFLSLLVAQGGVGKTAKIIAECLAMVTGKPTLGVTPERVLRVWYWNGEDPFDELQRRIAACCKHHSIAEEDIGDRLFVDSGRTLPIVIASGDKAGTKVAEPVIEGVIGTLLANKIDVLVVDPFVACHHVPENDNTGIEIVAKSWAHIAEAANCSIMLVHHVRKTYGEDATIEDSRGASALVAAVRTARTLNVMSKKEAEDMGIDPAKRRQYFRSDNGKSNMAVRPEGADH